MSKRRTYFLAIWNAYEIKKLLEGLRNKRLLMFEGAWSLIIITIINAITIIIIIIQDWFTMQYF